MEHVDMSQDGDRTGLGLYRVENGKVEIIYQTEVSKLSHEECWKIIREWKPQR